MAKRRHTTTGALAADRPQTGGRRKTGGASTRGMSSTRGAGMEPREAMRSSATPSGRGGRGNLMSGARNVAEQVGKTTRDAAESTMGAAREWAAGAADVAGSVANRAGEMGSQVAGKVRENPWPSLLIGAGATWLAIDAIRGRSEGSESSTQSRYETRDCKNERGTVGQAMSKVASAGRAAGGQIRAAGGQIEEFVRDRPLLAGAATLGLGVAVGMAMPSSVTENELFGGARDKIVSRARDAARSTANKVRDVAESVERLGPFGGGSSSARAGASPASSRVGSSRGRGGAR